MTGNLTGNLTNEVLSLLDDLTKARRCCRGLESGCERHYLS